VKVTAPGTRPVTPRLPAHSGEGLSETLARTAFGDDGRPLPIFGLLAHHEPLLRRFNALGGLLRTSPVTDPAHRELIVLRIAWRTDCPFEFDQHAELARAAGVSDELVAATRAEGRPVEPTAELLVTLADEVFEHDSITEETWRRLASAWEPAQVLELLMAAAFFRMAATVINAVGLRPRAEW
jgi:AhpD family alkylhydroperoxidase